MQITFKVDGMSCEGCARSISTAVGAVGAIANVDLSAGKVTLEYDENKVSLQKLKEAITDAGYHVCD